MGRQLKKRNVILNVSLYGNVHVELKLIIIVATFSSAWYFVCDFFLLKGSITCSNLCNNFLVNDSAVVFMRFAWLTRMQYLCSLVQQIHSVISIMIWSKHNLLSNRKIGQHECHLMINPPSLIKHLTSMHFAQCLMFY